MFWLSYAWLLLLIDVSVKSLLLAALAGAVLLVLRVRDTNVRHRVWTAVLVGMLVLPLLVPVTPSLPLPAWLLPAFAVNELGGAAAAPIADPVSASSAVGSQGEAGLGAPGVSPLPFVQEPRLTGRLPYDAAGAMFAEGTSTGPPPGELLQRQANQAAPRQAAAGPARPGPERRRGVWPLALLAVYVSVLAVLVLRFLTGILGTIRLAGEARPISPESLGVSASLTGSLVRVAVLEGPAIYLPITMGWLRPKILLPAQWRTWSKEKLGTVLAHELAHVQRGDYLVTLLAEWNRCLYWFHPLAWSLRSRLLRLAEQSCDDAVIVSTGDRTQYARHLIELAGAVVGRRGRLQQTTAIPIARRGNVETRIAAILDPARPLAGRVGRLATAVLIAVVAPAVLLAAALRPAGEQASSEAAETTQAGADSEPAAGQSPAPAAQEDTPLGEELEFRGRVLDPQGKPLAAARLYVPRVISKPPQDRKTIEMAQLAVTGPDGSFRVKLRADDFDDRAYSGVPLVAIAAGCGVEWVDLEKADPAAEIILRLVEDQPIRGRILNQQRQPVAGASITARYLGASSTGRMDRFLNAWKRETTSPDRLLHLPSDGLLDVETDREGRFEITRMGKERLAFLEVSGPSIAQVTLYVVTRDGFDPQPMNDAILRRTDKSLRHYREWPIVFGPTLEYVAEPAKVVRGTVRELRTEKGLSGVRVSASALHGSHVGAVTDDKGRYQLEGPPEKKEYNLYASPNKESGLVPRMVRVEATAGLEPMTADIELRRGIVVTGRIIDEATGEGVEGSVRFAPLPDNKHFGQTGYDSYRYERLWSGTDHEGRFRLVVIPGPGVLMAQVWRVGVEIDGEHVNPFKKAEFTPEERKRVTLIERGGQRWFKTARGGIESPWNAVKVLDSPEGAGPVTCDLHVQRGKTLDVNITGPEGKPLEGTLVCGMTESWPFTFPVKGARCTILALDPKRPRRLIFYHADRNLAATLTVRGDEQEPPTVRLAPAHTLTGRAVEMNGQPVAGAEVRVSPADETAQEFYRQLGLRRQPVQTDTDGRFRLEGVLPGLLFRLVFRQEERTLIAEENWETLRVVTEMALSPPGEVVDLGNLTVKPRGGPDIVGWLGEQLEAWRASLRNLPPRED